MTWNMFVLLGLIGTAFLTGEATAMGVRVTIYPERTVNCHLESIQAKFTSAKSTYRMNGNCQLREQYETDVKIISMLWSSEGAFVSQGGLAQETIRIRGNSPFNGTVSSRLLCDSDPWLGPSGAGKARCIQGQFAGNGEVENLDYVVHYLKSGFIQSQLPNTTGFQYNRTPLLAQRDADRLAEQRAAAQAEEAARRAAAEAEAARKKEAQRLRQATKPGPLLLENMAPSVLSPAVHALFLANTSVPIKITPPPGVAAASYAVKLENRNSQGIWTLVTNLPISAAQASSPSGYLEWGAPGNGKGAAMIAGPGTYRISAQVTAPRQTGWSQPVEFTVTIPNKAIQKAPKMFGQ